MNPVMLQAINNLVERKHSNGFAERLPGELVEWVRLMDAVDDALALPDSVTREWGGRFKQRARIAGLVFAWMVTLAHELGAMQDMTLLAEQRAILHEWRAACQAHTWPLLAEPTTDELETMLAYLTDWYNALVLEAKAIHSERSGLLDDEAEAQALHDALNSLFFFWCVGGWSFETLLCPNWHSAPQFPDSAEYGLAYLKMFCQMWQHLMRA